MPIRQGTIPHELEEGLMDVSATAHAGSRRGTARRPAPRDRRVGDRQRHRVVRLRHLRLRRHLPLGRPVPGQHRGRNAVRAGDVRHLVPRAAARRPLLGTDGRPARPQGGPGADDPPDGRGDVLRRPDPVVRLDRLLGARAPDRPAHGPGLLDRRRVRRRRDVHGRVRARHASAASAAASSSSARSPASRSARSSCSASRALLSDAQMESWGWRVPFLRRGAARPDRHVPAIQDGGHPGVPRARGEGREASPRPRPRSRTC